MVLMISYFINLLVSCYFCYDAIISNPDNTILFVEAIWLAMRALMILLIITGSTRMSSEVHTL